MKRQQWWIWVVFGVYVTLVTVFSLFHEVWRDEVVPLSLVSQSGSLPELYQQIKNYGHPGLWFSILYFAYNLIPHYSVIKVVNILINSGAAYLFLRKSPFARFQTILLLMGYFLFYYFPVVNRSYGLFWLFFVFLCTLFPQRWKKMWQLTAVLVLMANTHAAGLIIAFAVALTMAVEYIFSNRDQAPRQNPIGAVIMGGMVVAAGAAVSVWQTHTDSSSVIFQWNSLTIDRLWTALGRAVFIPGTVFPNVLGGEHASLVSLVIAGCYFLLRKEKAGLSVMFLGTVGLGVFFQMFYPYYTFYHQSFLYMLMIFAFWVSAVTRERSAIDFYARSVLLTVVMVMGVLMAYPAIQKDLSADFSSSRRFSTWLKEQPLGQDYVVMAEPDYIIESLPYYITNEIYIPREKVFAKMRRFTTDNQRTLTLDEFLDAAQMLKAQGRSVALVMGHQLKKEGPFMIKFSYGEIFRYSTRSLERWESQTKKAVELRGGFYGGENYDVYVLQ